MSTQDDSPEFAFQRAAENGDDRLDDDEDTSEDSKPDALEVIFENVPDELHEYPHWINWQYEERTGNKPAKPPFNPVDGRYASTDDPETWSDYSTAKARLDCPNSEYDGFGVMLCDTHRLVGVDLDDCRDPETGEVGEWAESIVRELDSYTEVSPSGAGLHIFVFGELPGDSKRNGNVEIYDDDRYLTVTGRHVEGTSEKVEHQQDELDAAYEEFVGDSDDEDDGGDEEGENSTKSNPSSGSEPTSLDDEELLGKAKRSEKFARLWNGNTSDYDSPSEADMALCNLLAYWTRKDSARMVDLFGRSSLCREKWTNREDYRERTVGKAIEWTDGVYGDGGGPPEETVIPDDGALAETATSTSSNSKSKSNSTEDAQSSQTGNTSLIDVREVVTEEFDEQMWRPTEAALCAYVTLLIDGAQPTGLVIVGASGAGKTTVCRFFEGLDEVERSDDATPASFVSCDPSVEEEHLEENDLLPRIQHKTLLCRDMSSWFSGEGESIRTAMSRMAHLMDGEGLTRDSGSHGQRGYTGDYRFNFIGASTPLKARAWRVMGHTGNRFVFHTHHGGTDMGDVAEDVFDETEYAKKVSRCHEVIDDFLAELWSKHRGYSSVEWGEKPGEETIDLIKHLAQLVRYGRATIDDDGNASREGGHRIMATLRDFARGRALLEGRTRIDIDDVNVAARVALSTMPSKRRPAVRALLNPENDGELLAGDVEDAAGISRPTALKRMELLGGLGFGDCEEMNPDGDDETKILRLDDKMSWSDKLDFPKFIWQKNNL
jgi:primase-polymerase (primpol)-like protein